MISTGIFAGKMSIRFGGAKVSHFKCTYSPWLYLDRPVDILYEVAEKLNVHSSGFAIRRFFLISAGMCFA